MPSYHLRVFEDHAKILLRNKGNKNLPAEQQNEQQ